MSDQEELVTQGMMPRSEIIDNDGRVIGAIGTPDAMDDDEAYISLIRISRLTC